MLLTAITIKKLKPRDKVYTEADGNGLHLVINTNGSKKWRYRYNFKGKAKTFSLGSYPEISIANARELLRATREQVALGVDPSAKKKAEKVAQAVVDNRQTFKQVKTAFLHSIENTVSHHHYVRSESLLRLYTTSLDSLPITDITHKDIKAIIVNLSEKQQKKASAKKLFGVMVQVFDYAERFDYVEVNVCGLLKVKNMVTGHAPKKHATMIDTKQIKLLLAGVREYTGHYNTKKAMEFMLHTSLRSYNVRALKWGYIKDGVITIPKEEMKIAWDKVEEASDFRLPLSKQSMAILDEMRPLSAHMTYVFPSLRGDRPMSENALLNMIRAMGYTKEQFTPHGSRAMFSTIANESGDFNLELIDAHIAHKVGGSVSQAYNRGDYLEKRVKLSQWWSDWLVGL